MRSDVQRFLEFLPDHTERIQFDAEWARYRDKHGKNMESMTPKDIALYFWRRGRRADWDD